jgi:iron complex outermembrane receptor protein
MFISYKARLFCGAALAAVMLHPAAADEKPVEKVETVEKVVVTGSSISKSRDQFSTLVGIADRDDLTMAGGLNVADALSNIPGVTSTSFATGAGRPVIRGFDASRVRVLENGLGSFDVSDLSPDHGVPIDPLALQRVEIVRGPATLRYGSQAIGGVVNALNNRIPTALPKDGFSTDLHFAAGSVDNSTEFAGLADGHFGNFAWHVDAIHQDRDSYDTPLGEQINSQAEGSGYSLGGSLIGNSGHFGVAYVRFASEYGIPGEDAFIEMEQDKFLLSSEWRNPFAGFTALRLNAGVSDYIHDEVLPVTGPASTFIDKQYEVRSELVHGALGPFSAIAVGVQLQHRDFEALGEGEDFLFPSVTDSLGLYMFADAPLADDLMLELGLRHENTEVDGTPISDVFTTREYDPFSAFGGLVFNATDSLRFGANVSYAERAPNQVELYARGPHEATGTYEIGDPDMSLEKALNLEANAKLTLPGISAELTLFRTAFEGFVYGQLTGNSYDELGVFFPDTSEEFLELLYVQRDATFTGGEFEAEIPVGEISLGDISLNIKADWVNAEFDAGGNVPRIPPARLGGGISLVGPVIDAHVQLTHAFEQDDIADNETATDGYTRLDAGVTWHAGSTDAGDINVSLIGRNLLDEEIRNHVSFNKDEVTLAGSDVRLVLSLRR